MMNTYLRWFSRAVWLGILLNLFWALPAIIVPHRVLAYLNLEPTLTPIWVSFAAWLVMLLTLFYLLAALDPQRYRANAWLAVLARIAVAIFFFCSVFCFSHSRAYLLFGLIELFLGLSQGVLLFLAARVRESTAD
jgi:hypothetical protein